MQSEVKEFKCGGCGVSKEMTNENFKRSGTSKTGFAYNCRVCKKNVADAKFHTTVKIQQLFVEIGDRDKKIAEKNEIIKNLGVEIDALEAKIKIYDDVEFKKELIVQDKKDSGKYNTK